MDSVTHSLSGIVFSYTGFRQKFGFPGVLLFVLSTLFPDIDFIFNHLTNSIYVSYHRGFTHSFIYLPFICLVICLFFYCFYKKITFKNLYLISVAGMMMHVCFDLLNSYGTPVFLPFTSRQYALDLDIIIDAFFFIPLLAGVIGIFILRRYQKKIAILVAIILACGVFVRFIQRENAIDVMRAIEPKEKISIYSLGIKSIYNPFLWQGVVHKNEMYAIYSIDTLKRNAVFLKNISYTKEDLAGVIPKSKAIRDFLYWARFPFYKIENEEQETVIKLSDLRFQHSKNEQFMLIVRLNKDGKVIEEKFSFREED